MIYLIFFKDKKKAWLMMLITGVIVGCLLLSALIAGGIQLYKSSTYAQVTATVTDFDTRDGNNVWTAFTYEYNNTEHTVRLPGHSYWMRMDSEIDLLIHPDNPERAEVLRNSGTLPKVLFIVCIPFGVFFMLYGINYIIVRKKLLR